MGRQTRRGKASTELKSARTFEVDASVPEMVAKQRVRDEHDLGDGCICRIAEEWHGRYIVMAIDYSEVSN